jgi:hypothetical protein
MTVRDILLSETQEDFARTRRILERVPTGKLGWVPHPRSMSLGRLATHLAELPGALRFLHSAEVDISPVGGPPRVPNVLGSTDEIVALFVKNTGAFTEALAAKSEEQLAEPFALLAGGQTMVRKPRSEAVRVLLVQHTCHHRGQLTVYLRLLDVSVPSIFGPSADERPV